MEVKCPCCPRKLSRRNLFQHVLDVHKRFVCTSCKIELDLDRTYATVSRLDHHLNALHGGVLNKTEYPFECYTCTAALPDGNRKYPLCYSKLGSLRHHLKTKHQKNISDNVPPLMLPPLLPLSIKRRLPSTNRMSPTQDNEDAYSETVALSFSTFRPKTSLPKIMPMRRHFTSVSVSSDGSGNNDQDDRKTVDFSQQFEMVDMPNFEDPDLSSNIEMKPLHEAVEDNNSLKTRSARNANIGGNIRIIRNTHGNFRALTTCTCGKKKMFRYDT